MMTASWSSWTPGREGGALRGVIDEGALSAVGQAALARRRESLTIIRAGRRSRTGLPPLPMVPAIGEGGVR